MAVLLSASNITTPQVTLGESVLAAPSGAAPAYTCRAWVDFNGQGTVAILTSGNVSSITDNGTGNYTVNLATDLMPDANFATVAFLREDDGGQTIGSVVAKGFRATQTVTTSRVQSIIADTATPSVIDAVAVYVMFFR